MNSLLDAMSGEDDVVECAYVKSDETEAKYFSTPLVLGVSDVHARLSVLWQGMMYPQIFLFDLHSTNETGF